MTSSRLVKALAAGLAIQNFLACASTERKGYLVAFYVQGSENAFRNRQISVSGKRVPDPSPADSTGEVLESYVELCTADRQKFLDSPIRLLVRAGDVTIDEAQVQRVACRDAQNAGEAEENHVIITDDGRLLYEFGLDSRVWATCFSHPSMYPCPHDEF